MIIQEEQEQIGKRWEIYLNKYEIIKIPSINSRSYRKQAICIIKAFTSLQ